MQKKAEDSRIGRWTYFRFIASKIHFLEKGEGHGEKSLSRPLDEPIDRATVHQTSEMKFKQKGKIY